MNCPPVFLTYGWCRVSFVVLDSLAKKGVPVHVGDASGCAMCRFSRRVASFHRYRHPYRDPDGFVADVLAAVEKTQAKVLLPGHEDSLLLARHRGQLPSGVQLPVAESTLLDATANKWQLTQMAEQAGVPVPKSVKPDNLEELHSAASAFSYPAVVKTQRGNSAKTVYVVKDAQDCVATYKRVIQEYSLEPPRWPMLQAFVPGAGYGVCLLYNQGQFRAAFCERYLHCKQGQFGTSVFRESVSEPKLVEMSRQLLDGRGWHGVVHLDYLYEPTTGQAALLEINPRFWGALDLAVRSGVDFPWLLYKIATEGDCPTVTKYQLGVRSRWLAGELIALANGILRPKAADLRTLAKEIFWRRANGHDDFRWRDPLPLAGELLYYASEFLKTRSTNPLEEGMVG